MAQRERAWRAGTGGILLPGVHGGIARAGTCPGAGEGAGRGAVPQLSRDTVTPISGVPLLWFQQFITPVRPPASSATMATASRSAGRATATPTARTALMRTLPAVVTCPVCWGGSATGGRDFCTPTEQQTQGESPHPSKNNHSAKATVAFFS